MLNKKYEILSLIKPQFEVEKKLVGKGGIIKDNIVPQDILNTYQITQTNIKLVLFFILFTTYIS